MSFQPNTNVYLCSVPLILGNGNQIKFETIEQQYDYFYSKIKHKFEEQSYQRLTSGVFRCELNAEQIITGVNYIMFQNQNYGTKWFYGNVLKITYINENLCQVDYAVDSYQTFQFDIDLTKKSYIDRRHYSKNDETKEIMNLPFEDIDLGNKYINCDTQFYSLFSNTTLEKNNENNTFYVLISSKSYSKTSISNNVTTNFNMISYPYEFDDESNITKKIQGEITSQLYYLVVNYPLLQYLYQNNFFTNITNNGTLQQVIMIPYGNNILKTEDIRKTDKNWAENLFNLTDKDRYQCYSINNFNKFITLKNEFNFTNLVNYIRKIFKMNEGISIKSSGIARYLLRYPYSVIEFNDGFNYNTYKLQDFFNGNIDYLLNNNNNLSLNLGYSVGPTSSIKYQFLGYKNIPSYFNEKMLNNILKNDKPIYEIIFGSNHVILNNYISLPTISNNLSAFLQANQNQINAQRMNASDSLNVSLQNANATMQAQQNATQLGYQNSIIGANTALENAQISGANGMTNAGLANDNAMLGIMGSAANSGLNALGNFASGNIGGGISGIAGAGINSYVGSQQAGNNFQMASNNVNSMLAQASNSNSGALQQASNSLLASMGVINTGYANAERSATLNYQNTIRSLNARVEDIKNLPDSVQSAGAGSFLDYLLNFCNLSFISKSLPENALNRLINYFCLYGFKSNSLESIQSCIDKFETGLFIKTVNANITADIPQNYLKEIITMFDSGIFIWNGPENYLDYEKMKGE